MGPPSILLHAKALLALWGIMHPSPVILVMLVFVQWRIEASKEKNAPLA